MIPIKHEYIPYEEVYNAYVNCLKRKRKTKNASEFQINVAKKLYKLYLDLNNQKYTIGGSIAFIVEKPVKREVFAANFRDRIVHHIVINRIITTFESKVIDNSFSCRKGKGTLCAIKTLEKESREITENYTKNAYVMKCDLKSFFMTISKEKLYECISNLISNEVHSNDEIQCNFLCSLVKQIIFNKPQLNCIRKTNISKWKEIAKDKSLFTIKETYGLPIGNLTSQIFANYFLNDFDHFIYNELGFKYYGRYVDDFYILSEDKKKLLASLVPIRNKLSMQGVKLHPNKLYIQNIKKGVAFVGGIIKPNRTYVGNRTINNFKIAISEFNNSEKTISNLNHYISVFNSYFGFLKHHNSFNVKRKLIKRMHSISRYCYFTGSLDKISLFKKYRKLNTYLS